MPDSLVDLENRRATVQMQIAQLGDMRSGSITATSGRCGNPNCHCHRAGEAGPMAMTVRISTASTCCRNGA